MIKRGLVLGGGGSRGAYQVGVWQALRELDIKIDIITGTSIGALNGALMVQDDYDGCLNLWNNMCFDNVLSNIKQEDFDTLSGTRQAFLNFLKGVISDGGLDIEPLEKTVREMLDEDKVRASNINFGVVTVEFPTMKEVALEKDEIPHGKLADYLLASAACYPAFKSRNIDDSKYVDGGYKNNLPIDMAADMGANEIIAVDLEAVGTYVPTEHKDVPVRYIKSYWNLGMFLSFDKDRIVRNMKLGYLDVMRSYKLLEGTAYTFKLGEKDKLFLKSNILETKFKNMLGFTLNDKPKSTLDNMLRSRIIKTLNNRPNARVNLKEYALKSIEIAAESMDIPPTNIYNVVSLCEKIVRKFDDTIFISSKEIELAVKEPKNITKLTKNISNYEKKEIISYIYKNIEKAYLQKEVDTNIKLLATVATREFIAAIVIFMIKNIDNNL